jgi:hypothetical protein
MHARGIWAWRIEIVMGREAALPMVAQAYEIRVEASTHIEWKSRFEEVCVTLVGDEEVVLRGVVQDEPALHGLLGRIRAAGLVLKSVELTPAGKEEL